MSTRNYWLDLFSETTWQEFLDSGAHISGFREGRWKILQQVKPGDYFLCYLTRFSRWIGILEVVSAPFKDNSPIWKDETFPCRVEVKVIVSLTPETSVPITLLRDQLSIFDNLNSPFAWTGHVRGAPTRWKPSDGEIILQVLLDAQTNPITRPVTKQKQERLPTVLPAKIGVVTVPNGEESADESLQADKEPTLHTETQWLLLKLGNDMGLDVWVASNDRSRNCNGHQFTELPHLKRELPLQFDAATNRTIELIDALWLKGDAEEVTAQINRLAGIFARSTMFTGSAKRRYTLLKYFLSTTEENARREHT